MIHKKCIIVLTALAISAILILTWQFKHTENEASNQNSENSKHTQPKSAARNTADDTKDEVPLGYRTTHEDYLAQIRREMNGKLIDSRGNPNSAIVSLIAGWQDEALSHDIQRKISAVMNELSVMLKKRNEAIPLLPWKAGTKIHLIGLGEEELLQITNNLTLALKEITKQGILEQISQRFRDEVRIYSRSIDVDVKECALPEGRFLVVGGVGSRPLSYFVVVKDANGMVMTEEEWVSEPGDFAKQYFRSK